MSWAGAQAGRALGRETELEHRRGPTTSMGFSAEPRPHVLLSAGRIRPGCQRCSWETENREARVGTGAPRGSPASAWLSSPVRREPGQRRIDSCLSNHASFLQISRPALSTQAAANPMRPLTFKLN